MNVLMVASECFPLVKTGGLADVVGALSGALQAFGCHVRVMLPYYPAVATQLREQRVISAFDLFGAPASMIAARSENKLEIVALDAPHLYDRPGSPYLDPEGRDWSDNHRRFAALARAAARLVVTSPDGWSADVVHCHDWQSGLTPVYLAATMTAAPPVVFTIHNIAFPGLCAADEVEGLGLPASGFNPGGFEYYGKVSLLKAGLVYSDRLTTVSPTYATELQTPAFGMGFDGVLRARRAVLIGILNGIDETIWNPETDLFAAAAYSKRSFAGKRVNRAAVQQNMALDPDEAALLVCVVSRLTNQKGLDILVEALPVLIRLGGQLALLGTGDSELEAMFTAAAAAYPGRVGVRITYDEALSHLLLAGADAILVPSRFEPCGLTQLYGLRYGTIPIVARTGGLADSIIDANTAATTAGVATGIMFDPIDAEGLGRALGRAAALFGDPTSWSDLVHAAMKQQVGWSRSAARYAALYQELVGSDRRPSSSSSERGKRHVDAT
jgi:starch synthase